MLCLDLTRYCAFLNILILFIFPFDKVSAWEHDMVGGMKLFIKGDIYSFTTAQCPGGVFFKNPVEIWKICMHGYFLRRPNGCQMKSSDIIGGSKYTCASSGKIFNQAFIPLTNPDFPLDHTLSFYDEPDSLKNFRRFTYVRGIEGKYQESSKPRKAIGAMVVNPRKIPKIAIENVCYKGLNGAGALWGEFPKRNLEDSDSSGGFFTRTCKSSDETFPRPGTKQYDFLAGYSNPKDFKGEIPAKFRAGLTFLNATRDLVRFEIWNGLAYCLQEFTEETDDHKLIKHGIFPPINELNHHCNHEKFPTKPIPKKDGLIYKIRLAKTRINVRRKRSAGADSTEVPVEDSDNEIVQLPSGACRKPPRPEIPTTPAPVAEDCPPLNDETTTLRTGCLKPPKPNQQPVETSTLPLCPPDDEAESTTQTQEKSSRGPQTPEPREAPTPAPPRPILTTVTPEPTIPLTTTTTTTRIYEQPTTPKENPVVPGILQCIRKCTFPVPLIAADEDIIKYDYLWY